MAELHDDAVVTVCDACLRACCWRGFLFCDEYLQAGTVEKTVAELKRLAFEHPDYWEIQEQDEDEADEGP